MNHDTKLKIAGHMPPLTHWPDKAKPFDPNESQVVQWIISQPEFRNRIARMFQSVLIYDEITGTWKGKNYIE